MSIVPFCLPYINQYLKDIYGYIQNSFLGKIVDPNEAKTTSDKKQEPQNRNLEFKLAEFLRNRDKLPISLRVPDFTGNYFSIVSKGRDQQSNVIVKPKEKNFYANKLVDALDLNFNANSFCINASIHILSV